VTQDSYAVAWTGVSRRALVRLPEKVATAVTEFVYGSLVESPHRVGKPLRLGLDGLYSARRGDYRVIYRIDDDRRVVTVMAIEHRSDVYRPRQL
jgi:mRNA interferase RelE/StbE